MKPILLHVLFWIGVWFFFLYFLSYNSSNTAFVTSFSSILLPVTMVICYFVVYYLIPRYLLEKKYALFMLYSIYTVVFSTYIILLTIFGFFLFMLEREFEKIPIMSRNVVFVLVLIFLVVILVSFVSLLNRNLKTASANRELQNKILESQLRLKNQELQFLKSQIQPHFLFNTLNTIYGFALKKSEKTADIILKLSELLDYILYQTGSKFVPLISEIDHLNSYIELEKFRFQESLDCRFVSDIEDENMMVPPMLFIPFVENAFKHGSAEGGVLQVEIGITQRESSLVFYAKNSAERMEKSIMGTGIGIENIRKRLSLLYPDNHELHVCNSSGKYTVELKINLIHDS